MKTRNLILTALTALALSVLAGCSSETEFPQETPDIIPPGVTRIEFAIKGVKTGTSYAASPTVALEENERTINDVTAYLFKLDGNDVLNDNSIVTDVLPATLGNNTGKGSFDLGKSTTETRYGVVFIANKACFNSALAAVSKTSNTTYADLNAIETMENTTIMAGLGAFKGLPMRALTTIIVPVGSGKVAMDAKFARPLSRFDIDNRAVHSFKVESVKLKNGRKTSLINVPGIAGKVTGTVSDIDYTSLLSDVNEKLTTPNADGSNTQLRPAFYVSPALSTDNASIEVTGELRIGADYYPRTYNVPLVSKDTQSPITLGINKRYRLTLLMDKDDNLVGEVAIDLGEWGDDGTDNPDVSPDLDLQVNPTGITEGATYTTATRTFNVPGGVGSFQFEMLNDAGLNVATDGTVVVAVAAVTAPISRGVNATIYKVTLSAAGTGHFTFATDGGTQYRFNVELAAFDPSKYPGTNLDPVEFGNILWAPVNVGATKIGEPGWLFQFGRMSHWNSTADIANNLETITSLLPSKAATDYLGKFLVPTDDEGRNWWGPQITAGDEKTALEALIAYWNGVSDDATTTTHPCPTGWRLPTSDEAKAFLQGASQTTGTVNGVSTVAVNGVTFVAKEYYKSNWEGHVPVTGESLYWLKEEFMNSSSNPMNLLQCTSTTLSFTQLMRGSAYGLSIRCVKDKPVTL